MPQTANKGSSAEVRFEVKNFPQRTDFLHRVPADAIEKNDDSIFLDPGDSQIERMPVIYAQIAMYIPSIMHHVENALLTDKLNNGVLAPIRFSVQAEVFPAICAPAAKEDTDYQRLEFLGDSILKMLTSTTPMAEFASHSLGGVHLRRPVSLHNSLALRKIESKVSGVYGSLEFLRST